MEAVYLLISSGPYPEDGYQILSAGTKQQMKGLKRDLMEPYTEFRFNSSTKQAEIYKESRNSDTYSFLTVKEVPVNQQAEDIRKRFPFLKVPMADMSQ